MRKLATVQKVLDIQPIEGADAIEKAKVKDWWVVVKKGDFSVGDLAVYFEIDSFLPVKPEYEFLLRGSSPKKMQVEGGEVEGIRLKTIRLRGQISQGLLMPIPYGLPREEGVDLSEQLEVIKYEMPIPVSLSGEIKGSFPGFLPKTDEERIQNCGYLLDQYRSLPCYVTSKLDGTSATYYKHEGVFGVCSRNLELNPGGTIYWRIAESLKLSEILPEGFSIQGEIVGDGIQGNPLKLARNVQKLYVFNVYDILNARYLNFREMVDFVEHLGLETVPIISDNFTLDHSVESLLELATDHSPLNKDVLQEGIVIRPLEETQATICGVLGRLSFKVISNDYLLNVEK